MITKLEKNSRNFSDKKLNKAFLKLQSLVDALNLKEIPEDITTRINDRILSINEYQEDDKSMRKTINRAYGEILTLVRKKLGLVPINYYTNLWMALGLSVFGVPFGIGISMAIRGDVALMGAFLALGLPIGLAIGGGLDKKAKKEGKQLDI